jgi:hypothetical protein
LRELLEEALRGHGAHVADTFEDLDTSSLLGGAHRQVHEEMEPELAEMTAKVTEEYLHRWLDMKIPALGGRTPRQPAKSGGNAKKAVMQMLKEQESGWERRGLGAAVDFAGAWKELGMRHPSQGPRS